MATKLPDKERLERHNARGRAVNYATLYLRRKYSDEYKALYAAYLTDNGIYDNQLIGTKGNN